MLARNWCRYNKKLVQKEGLALLIDPKNLKFLFPKKQKQRGGPHEFSDGLIELLLLIKIHYKLTYRSLEGFAKSIFSLQKESL